MQLKLMIKFHSTLKALTCLLVLGSLASVAAAQNSSVSATRDQDCMSCHEKNISGHAFNNSVHKSLKCTACHVIDQEKPESSATAGKNPAWSHLNRPIAAVATPPS